jgi:hypothetical protein
MICMCIARIRLEIHVNNKLFCTNFLVESKFSSRTKNRYSEGMDGGQKTPRGHPDFNSYVKILRVFIFQMDRQTNVRTDERTDRQTEKLIRCGLGNLIGSSRLSNKSMAFSLSNIEMQ